MNTNFIIVIVGMSLLLMVLAAISSVAQSDVPRSDKAGWILLLVLLPLLGWAIWWGKGPKRA
ncbi:MAG: PLDc N-terminal domain-containing protein [Pseudomonas sp.]